MTVRVVTAAEAASRDAAAIESGIPSRALMQRAGGAAAAELCRRFADRLHRGVAIFAGPGNNGGDAWVVAGALAAAGVSVRVIEVLDAKTPDAQAERATALAMLGAIQEPTGAEEVIVDGVLGTGARSRPRGAAADAVSRMSALRDRGAVIVALDIPTGVDATTGEAEDALRADLTLTFGTLKRGLLVARDRAGEITVLDIGLGAHVELGDGAPALVDARWVAERIPGIAADAHKGTRGKLAIIGGAQGMAGASILAGHAALRSGAGMVRVVVAPGSVPVAQSAAPDLLAHPWPTTDDAVRESVCDWADGVLIGPGLGRSPEAEALLERVLRLWRGPIVADADALNHFEGRARALGEMMHGRPAILTPHPTEFSRLAGLSTTDVLARRFDVALDHAPELGAVVLLKGVPTVITDPDGTRLVSAAGTPVLATAGSGDLLAGIAATLVMQTGDALASAASAAWIHGRAAEHATGEAPIRGRTLFDVLDALPRVWHELSSRRLIARAPVLAELPRVGDL